MSTRANKIKIGIVRNKQGKFVKGHPSLNKKPNSGSFKKGKPNANKGKRGLWGVNKGSFQKGHIPHYKGKKISQTTGVRHWNWKGGITVLAEIIRKHFKYRQWRSDVFTRDDFTCRFCDIRGAYLEVDHFPKEFSDILEEYKIKTLDEALNCEELWNINNGRTLCEKCHNLTKHGRPKTKN